MNGVVYRFDGCARCRRGGKDVETSRSCNGSPLKFVLVNVLPRNIKQGVFTVLLWKSSARSLLFIVETACLTVSGYVERPESWFRGYRVLSSAGNRYEYKGFRIVIRPVGELTWIFGTVAIGGMSGCQAQSQYGSRKLSAAAWYVGCKAGGYVFAMAWICVASTCYCTSVL